MANQLGSGIHDAENLVDLDHLSEQPGKDTETVSNLKTGRVFIYFIDQDGSEHRAVIPIARTYEDAVQMAMKTFAPYFPAPDPNPCDYHLKYARTVDGRYIHFYIDPAYWEVVMDGDDLLLYHDKLLDDSNSSNTLSIQNNKPESSDDKAVARKMTKRQTVSYRFSTVVKNTPTIVYAAGFLPNSYEDAVSFAAETLKTYVVADKIATDNILLRIASKHGHDKQIDAVVPRRQWVDYLSQKLSEDPQCEIVVCPISRLWK